MLKLRSIDLSDYAVLEGRQRIGRIRFAEERLPPRWLWNVTVHLPGVLPMGSSKDLDTARVEFKTACEELKASTPPEQLAARLPSDEHPGRRRLRGHADFPRLPAVRAREVRASARRAGFVKSCEGGFG
jgi:hypothetical protein